LEALTGAGNIFIKATKKAPVLNTSAFIYLTTAKIIKTGKSKIKSKIIFYRITSKSFFIMRRPAFVFSAKAAPATTAAKNKSKNIIIVAPPSTPPQSERRRRTLCNSAQRLILTL
jgi:hypothetical protein